MRVIALAVLMATSLVLSSPVPATQRAMAQPATASDSVHQEDDSSSSADAAYFDLGDFHREVTAKNPAAQTWFDRGLAMCYAFNHEEAVRCFERALVEEPGMAMAFWGLAYAWGPNINNMEIESHQIAQASYAIRLASLHSKNATQLERDLIDASTKRFAVPVPDDREPLNLAYSQAMRDVYRKYPQDPMVASLFAESRMILRPGSTGLRTASQLRRRPRSSPYWNSRLSIRRITRHFAICTFTRWRPRPPPRRLWLSPTLFARQCRGQAT